MTKVTVSETTYSITVAEETVNVTVADASETIQVQVASGASDIQIISTGETNSLIASTAGVVTTLKTISAGDNITLSDDGNTITISGEPEDDLSNNTTDDLAEGSTNLYYTDARVDAWLQGGGVTAVNFENATTLTWNSDDGTLEFPVNNEVTLQIGQEQHIHVKNVSGTTLTNGTCVYVTGASGSKITVDRADSSDEFSSATTIAVMTQDLNNNGVGYATTQGLVRGLDTSTLTEGAALYLNSNGAFSETKPQTPHHLVPIGWVVRSHHAEGAIYVHINNGQELEELHDVLITSVQDGDLVKWNATAGYWENAQLETELSSVTGNIIPSANIAYDLGSPTHMWRDLYVGPGSLYVDGQKVVSSDEGTIDITTDAGQNMRIAPGGTLDLDSGNDITRFLDNSITLGTSNATVTVNGQVNADTVNLGDLQLTGTLFNQTLANQNLEIRTNNGYLHANVTDLYVGPLTGAVKIDENTISSTVGNLTITGDLTGDVTGTVSSIANHNTDALTEGLTNLWYTDARVNTVLASTPVSTFTNDAGYLTSYTETDPVFTASPAAGITTQKITNWDTAYTWGNHATQGYATQTYVDTSISNLIDTAPTTLDTLNELAAALGDDPNFATTVTNQIATKWTQDNTKISNWDTAYSWGDHSLAGYLTSYTETDPVYTASSWYTTTNNSVNWDTAYSWGNHASAGYLTSYTETDPIFSASAASGITATNITNWNTAYGWGDHSVAGYLTSYTETDPIYTASSWYSTTNNSTNWNTAYSWGDHSLAGYLTSYTETDPIYTASSWYTTTNNALNWDTAYGWGDHSIVGYLTDLSAQTTSNLSEGTNLYFTDARAISAVQNEATLDLTGQVTMSQDLDVSGLITIADGFTLSSFNPFAGSGLPATAMSPKIMGVGQQSGWAGMTVRSRGEHAWGLTGYGIPNEAPRALSVLQAGRLNGSSDDYLNSGDKFAQFMINPYSGYKTGTEWLTPSAIIEATATENHSSSGMGTKLRLWTTENGDFGGATDAQHAKDYIEIQGTTIRTNDTLKIDDDVSITGTLDVNGAISNSTGVININDDATITGTLDVNDIVTVNGSVSSKVTTIGDTTIAGTYDGHGVYIAAGDNAWASITLEEYEGGASKPISGYPNPQISSYVYGGTVGSPAAVSDGSRLLGLTATAAYDNSGNLPTTANARLIFQTSETQSSTNRGSVAKFFTTPNGTSSTIRSFETNGNIIKFGESGYQSGDAILRTDGGVFKVQNAVNFESTIDAQGAISNSTGDVQINDNLTVTGNEQVNGTLTVDGTANLNGNVNLGNANTDSIQAKGYLKANNGFGLTVLDTATANYLSNVLGIISQGDMAYITDGDAGSPCIGVYNGSSWKRVSFGSDISTS